jgi:HPr kinase/phosphorylase
MDPVLNAPALVNIHASCVAVGARGILLLGASGQGKSDIAMRLIDRGARLVADDRCDIWTDENQLWCRPPALLAGKLEIRGLGIVDEPYTAPVALALAVRLSANYDRMPPAEQMEKIADRSLALVTLSGFEASTPSKILRALDALAVR